MKNETPLSERTLVLTRRLDCPPELAYRAWTEHLAEWWGPHGMTTPFCAMDLRPGGVLRTLMRAADGTEYPTAGVFLEVVPGRRLVFTDAYGPGWEPLPGLFFTAVTTFTPNESGGTDYEAKALHWTAEAARHHEAMGFHRGWGESADRFERVIARLRAAGP